MVRTLSTNCAFIVSLLNHVNMFYIIIHVSLILLTFILTILITEFLIDSKNFYTNNDAY